MRLGPLLPKTPIALIAEALPPDAIGFCTDHALEGLHLDGHQLSAESAQQVVSAGLQLRCYTINSEDEAMRLVSMGVDVIMTDFPEQFLADSSSLIPGGIGLGVLAARAFSSMVPWPAFCAAG